MSNRSRAVRERGRDFPSTRITSTASPYRVHADDAQVLNQALKKAANLIALSKPLSPCIRGGDRGTQKRPPGWRPWLVERICACRVLVLQRGTRLHDGLQRRNVLQPFVR